MGLATFVRIMPAGAGDDIVQADFPLAEGTVRAIRSDGSAFDFPRSWFDRVYAQQTPGIAPVRFVEDAAANHGAYESPQLSLLPPSYELLYRTIRRIEDKVDRVLNTVSPDTK